MEEIYFDIDFVWAEQLLHRGREFYEEKKEEHELLERVIRGEASFSDELERLIHQMDVSNPQKEFREYLGIIKDLGAHHLDFEDLEKRCKALVWAGGIELAYGISLAALGIASIAFLVPPFALAEPIIALLGGSGIAALETNLKYAKETKKYKDYYFRDLRAVAAHYDLDIGRHFLFDHFRDNREAFERTYRALPDEERREVAESLKRRLDAGLLDMGELELEHYLLGLELEEEGVVEGQEE